MTSGPPLRVAVIADHLVGHVRQAEAVVAAIAEVRPVEVTRLAVRKRSFLNSHHLRKAVLGSHFGGLVPLVLAGDWDKPFDLIVSAGGATLTGNVLLKRRNRATSIYSGWVRGIRPGDIDCILTHRPEDAGRPDHVFGPMPVLRWSATRPPHRVQSLPDARIGVVIGGEARGAGFDFRDSYCGELFRDLLPVAQAHPGTSWVIVTSRRTPEAGYPDIEAFCRAVPTCELVDYRISGQGSIARAYSCDAVLVTEDSKSMLTEFVNNGVPVGVLAVPRTDPAPSEEYIERLKRENRLLTLFPGSISVDAIEAVLASGPRRSHDVYAETRALIAQKLPALFPAPAEH